MKLIFPTRMIAAVAPCMANKDVRWYLNAILLERLPVTGGLRAVATDGHVIAVARDESTKWECEAPLLLPRKLVEGLLKAAKGDAEIALEIEGLDVRATVGGVTLADKLVDGRFPDYQACLPDTFDGGEGVFNPELLECFIKSAKDLKKRGVIGRWMGMKMVGNGVERVAGVNLHGITVEGFSVGGCVMPLRDKDQRDREGFLAHLKAA